MAGIIRMVKYRPLPRHNSIHARLHFSTIYCSTIQPVNSDLLFSHYRPFNMAATSTATITANGQWMTILDHKDTSEAISNGIWYEILQRHFSFPNFIIAPEERNKKGRRPDLTVVALIRVGGVLKSLQPIFTFEGKEPGQGGDIEASMKQAAGYLLPLKHYHDVRFGMVARGSTFVVIAYNGTGTADAVVQWIRGDANASLHEITKGWKLQSLTIPDNVTKLDGFLADLATKF
ncbi:hypothetical protein DER45DRAFT_557050 [Fusarium avenaceum]|nr:hypothetical protein DER45DRAFT_557050 [Fusarium avenaceum]